MKNIKEKHLNPFREYMIAICEVDNAGLNKTAVTLLQEATNNCAEFLVSMKIKYSKNMGKYLSDCEERGMPQKLASDLLFYGDLTNLREYLTSLCSDQDDELDKEKLKTLRRALEGASALMKLINNVEKPSENSSAEAGESGYDPTIEYAADLFEQMVNAIAKGKKRSPSSSVAKANSVNEQEMLPKHRNEIDDILTQLDEILNRMLANSIIEDLTTVYRSDQLADFVANASEEELKELFGEMKDVNVLLNKRKLQNAPSKEGADRKGTAKEEQNNKPVTINDVFGHTTPEKPSKYYLSIEHDLEQLRAVNQKLDIYCETYPTYALLRKLYRNGLELRPEMFVPNSSSNRSNPYSESVTQYQKLLYECKQSITLNNPLAPPAP